jgi:hypothetical protein
MPKKRMPVAERRREPVALHHRSKVDAAGNRPDAGLTAGPERALTWAGEPLNAKACGLPNRGASWTP